MNKTMKRKSIILASVACAVLTGSAVGVLGMNSNSAIQASAETTLTEQSFVMPGASVRIATDKNGIRFPVWLPVGVYEANKSSISETGTLLCPKELYDDTQLTVEAYQSETSKTDGAVTTDKWVKYTDPETGTEYYQSMIYLYNIPTTDMETEIVARGYVKIGNQTLYSPMITRSMAEVSYQALQDPEYASHATTLQGYLGNYVVELDAQEETFETYASISGTTPTANDLTVDLSAYENVTTAKVTAIANGERMAIDPQYVSVADKKVTINGAAFGASVYGDVDLQIITDNNAFETSVSVVTKYIANAADLTNMYWYGGLDTSVTGKPYDGYFVMTADVDCNNTPLNYRVGNDYLKMNAASDADYDGSYGFQGIFDGQGHKIYNISMNTYHWGLFGNTAKCSVIKNVAFLGTQNITQNWGGGFLIAHTLSGALTNCYVDVSIASTSTMTSEYSLLAWSLQYAKLSDLVIKYDASVRTSAGATNVGYFGYNVGNNTTLYKDCLTASNVYVFTTADRAWVGVWNVENNESTTYWAELKAQIMKNVTVNGYDEQGGPVTMTDDTYWALGGDQPIFKSVGSATRTVIYTGDTYQTTAFEAYDDVTVNYTGAHYEAAVTSYTLTPNTFSVDLNGYNLPENPTSIKLIGEKASKNIATNCFSNGVLTIADFGSDIYGEVSVEFTAADCIYKVSSFNVVTKYIDETADLANIYFYGGWDVENRTTYDYNGYFVMRADVGSLSSALSYRSSKALWTTASYAYYYGNAGFKGVFDGQGHTIQYAMWGGYDNTTGIFGSTQIGSEIKNVKFEGSIFEVSESRRGGFLLGRSISSKITNCYFDISAQTSNTTTEFAALAMYMTYAQLKDVVIKADFSNMISTCPAAAWLCYGPGNMASANDGGSWNAPSNAVTFENVYVFTDAKQGWVFNYANTSGIVANASINALNATVSGVTMTDSTYWDLTGNQPVWKGVSA